MNLRTAFYRARESLLYPIYKALSSLPIPDPHHGYEGILLDRGAKPYGYIGERITHGPDFVVLLSKNDIANIQQRAFADHAVAAGRLLKYELRVPAEESQFKLDMIVHHYCQPQFLDDMMAAVRQMEAYWRGEPDVHLSREFGYYIGCTDTDMKLGEKSKLTRDILWHISPLTRFCRKETLVRDASNGTLAPLRTRP